MKDSVKSYTTRTKTIKLNDLRVSPYLEKYGIAATSDFVTKQMKKFGLKPDQIIVTKDNVIIHNAEGYEQAKKLKMKEVEVVVIENLEEGEIIQVTSFKNIDKKKSRKAIAELIVELEEYMNDDEMGKTWREEIPGERIKDKIAFLLGISYGTVFSISEMYKYKTDLLDKIDEGHISIKEAMLEVEKEKEKLEPKEGDEADDEEDSEKNDSNTDEEEQKRDDEEDDSNSKEAPDKKDKEKVKGNRYAGQKDMVKCEKLIEIQLVYKDGRTDYLCIDDTTACLESNGVIVRDYKYESNFLHPKDQAEVHCFVAEKGDNIIELSIVNPITKAA